jgi:hypothetical protein
MVKMLKQSKNVEIVNESEEKGNSIQELIMLMSKKQSIFEYIRKNPQKASVLIILVGVLTLFLSGRVIRFIMSGAATIIRVVMWAYAIKNALRFLPKFRKKKLA